MSGKSQNILYTTTIDQLNSLLRKIKDLTAINTKIVMRIEQSNVLLLSFVGESFKTIHAFKSYVFPIEEIMNIKKGDLSEPIIFIINDGKKLYKTIENFLDYKEDIKCKMSIDDENYVNYVEFDNSKLDIKVIGGDPVSLGSAISIDDINHLMDIDKSSFHFRLNRLDFTKIKKMGSIDNEPKGVFYININNKMLSIGETKWHLNIDEIDWEDTTMSFPKSYFNTINPRDFIDIYAFEDFILCKYDDYNLMIVLEITI